MSVRKGWYRAQNRLRSDFWVETTFQTPNVIAHTRIRSAVCTQHGSENAFANSCHLSHALALTQEIGTARLSRTPHFKKGTQNCCRTLRTSELFKINGDDGVGVGVDSVGVGVDGVGVGVEGVGVVSGWALS